ncbi:YolA family protein [Anaerosalibacter bizertensis]|uniref:YolA family protein n=1 Tax=Anaerosalibacter bizertensis TaxID=932217 RepID=A0A9Q4ADL3_9FIRM|nr:DUF4879 domain-containing protein [Anaerosalibacter bizertensis]MBV1821996.1 YolA family protein [Bacteroidales bacterium MSK.15.36]MCB5560692.1 YolA family protein [Anaerosalibacter bizertensis]MCG4565963.1 YolA family protein [Anaerosalibacter bizertensis]MCG4583682.1 YolA family protein [Anaerosalibacter bizertensis]MCG4586681.1 YolA family protein [Anaerosalibacter bizertensis]
MNKKVLSILLFFVVLFSIGSQSFAASAPPLTSLRVTRVKSEKGGAEVIRENQLSTKRDHGGSYIYVTTEEIGYSSQRYAKFDNQEAELIDSKSIVGNNNIVIGWERTWKLFVYSNDNSNQGDFTYKAISANYPWNTMSTSIFIK